MAQTYLKQNKLDAQLSDLWQMAGAGSTQGVGGTGLVRFSECKTEAQGTMAGQGKSSYASCLLSYRPVSVL